MCGIAGIFDRSKPASATIVAGMLSRMRARGPDACGLVRPVPGVVLGSNRLAITDPGNAAADMPFAHGPLTIVYNGEIYNHRSLRSCLPPQSWRTQSDTESLLAAWNEWGSAALSRIEGMYAFALFDGQQLHLAVDPTGQKPLYYHDDGQCFTFASELKALLGHLAHAPEYNTLALAEAIGQRHILGADTQWQGIRKLPPGCRLLVDADGCRILRHWFPQFPPCDTDTHSSCDRLAHVVEQACDSVSDVAVPYGHLLSGGLDSSTVAALAARKGLDLTTYSVGFQRLTGDTGGIESVYDEFHFSRVMAQKLDSRHCEISLSADDYLARLDRLGHYLDEPLECAEAPCLIRLFEEIAPHHKVIFCGSGADEAFDGYGYGARFAGLPPDQISRHWFAQNAWLFAVDAARLIPDLPWQDPIIAKLDAMIDLGRNQTHDPLHLVQLIQILGRGAVYEFAQSDRISMGHSVEMRSPLADSRLINAALATAPSLLKNKHILKQACARFVPEEIAFRPKLGFPVPMEIWFSAAYEARIADALEPGGTLDRLGMIDMPYLRICAAKRDAKHRSVFLRLLILRSVLEQQDTLIRRGPQPPDAMAQAALNRL